MVRSPPPRSSRRGLPVATVTVTRDQQSRRNLKSSLSETAKWPCQWGSLSLAFSQPWLCLVHVTQCACPLNVKDAQAPGPHWHWQLAFYRQYDVQVGHVPGPYSPLASGE
jgi:hypothetical protein